MSSNKDSNSVLDAVPVRRKNSAQAQRTEGNCEMYGQITGVSDGDVEGIKSIVSLF